jgi:steroid 5-alpha reductase family enzyme
MTGNAFFDGLLLLWFGLALAVCLVLFFVPAPYGRHRRRGWGPTIQARWGWLIMESPAALAFALCFGVGQERDTVVALAFLLLWESHYVYRAFRYPFTLRGTDKRMPVAVAGMAFFFNLVNAYLNGRYLFCLSGGYPLPWLTSPQFVVGTTLFVLGAVINRRSDRTLRNLRGPGDSGYKIPRGGLYRWVTSPNYLGEIVEWIGWAVATWSLSGLTFATWAVANLAPRAWSNHRWYQERFPDYPPERKALVPGLW